MAGLGLLSVGVDSRAGGDEDEEEEHADGGGEEESAATDLVDEGSGGKSPSQVPDLEDTVDEELDGGVEDTDGLEDTGEVVRDDTVAGPLGEEGESDDDTHALEVAGGLEEGGPSNLLSDGAVELDGSLDFLVLVLDERILLIAVGVVVGEDLESLGVAVLADQPTRGLGSEPDKGDLDDGGETLESRGNTPAPGVLEPEGTEGSPRGAKQQASILTNVDRADQRHT